jgi:hypothetical protein
LISSLPLMALTMSIPFVTCPNTVCTPSRCRCDEWQIKLAAPVFSGGPSRIPATCCACSSRFHT